MTNITGDYALYDDISNPNEAPIDFAIFANPDGSFGGSVGGRDIQEGRFDSSTSRIFFTTQKPIGGRLSILVDFYTGTVVSSPKYIVMTGFHHHFGTPPNIFHGATTNWLAILVGGVPS